jgi:cell division protein FtsW
MKLPWRRRGAGTEGARRAEPVRSGKGRNHIDIVILIVVLALMVMSLGVVYSASSSVALKKFGESGELLGRHAAKVLLGLVAIFVFMHIDYHRLRTVSKPALIIGVILLIGTLALGGETKGARRWLGFGGFNLQPSEFAKYALMVHLAVLIAVKGEKLRDFKTGFLPMMIWIAGVTGLVFLQPNFSTGAMIVLLSLVMLFVGRTRLSHIAAAFAAVLPLMGLYLWSAEYRRRRILSFLAGSDGGGESINYQLLQGIIGFGNGGVVGVGPGESRQRDFYLPESYGDFVFSVVGEEYGLIGALGIMALFAVLMLRGLRVAQHARDDLGRFLAVGITSTVALYALINAGVTLGILPTTGLPMPFVSYGGSSIVFSSIAVGILLNISSQTDLHPRLTTAPENVRPLAPLAGADGGA